MMKKLIPALCLLLVSSFGETAQALDLLDLFRQAQINDTRYASAKAQYLALQERLPQARAGLLPDANLFAGYDWNDIDTEFDNATFNSGQRDFTAYNYGVRVTQPLYRRQNRLVYDQARIQVEQAGTDLELANQELVLRTAQSYFDILLARATLDTVRSQKTAVGEQLQQAKRNFVVGTATITDQREAQASYDLVIAEELGAQNELQVSTLALELLTGKTLSGELAGLQLPITLSAPSPSNINAWVEQSRKSSLEILRAQQQQAIAQSEIRRQRAGHGPTLDVVGSLSQNNQGSSSFGVGSDTRTAQIGLELNLPLYQGGAINSRTREALALHERAGQELENARRTVAQATRTAYLGVSSGIARVSALEQAVASTQLQLESTKLGQEVGVRTAVDVLNAEQRLAEARRNLAQAVYDTILSQLRLQAAVGRLVEADLQGINRLLKNGGS